MHGLFALVMGFLCSSAETFPFPCTYAANAPLGELQPHPACAVRRKGRLEISKDHLKRMSFSADGLAHARIDGGWYYVRQNGVLLEVITHDNGPDDFSEGLTRSIVERKMAYFDTQFTQVIAPKYDWGWPFKAGRALVCLGCTQGVADSDGHAPIEGGRWGYIDRKGNEIVPVVLSRAEAETRVTTQ